MNKPTPKSNPELKQGQVWRDKDGDGYNTFLIVSEIGSLRDREHLHMINLTTMTDCAMAHYEMRGYFSKTDSKCIGTLEGLFDE